METAAPTLTRHAALRCTQRGIPPAALSLLLDYGVPARLRGADSYALDRSTRRQLRAEIGERDFRRIERWCDAFAVVADDGRVITAAWRTRRLRRP